MTTIAIPVKDFENLSSKVYSHFGRSPSYLIINTDGSNARIVQNTSNHFGGKGSPTELIINEKVSAVLSKGMGQGALEKFAHANVSVYKVQSSIIQDNLKLFQDNLLDELTENCGHESGHHH